MNLPPLPPLPLWTLMNDFSRVTKSEIIKALESYARQAQREAVAAAVPVWMDIESAPKDGTEIIGYCDSGLKICSWESLDTPVSRHLGISGTWSRRHIVSGKSLLGGSFAPTHWMSLPAPPTEQAMSCAVCGAAELDGCETCTTECRAVELGRECPAVPFEKVNCWCESCDMAANGLMRSRMSLCPDCGNKRCPKAKHHDASCSGSNDPNQEAQP